MANFYSKRIIVALAAASLLSISAGATYTVTSKTGLRFRSNAEETELTLIGPADGTTLIGAVEVNRIVSTSKHPDVPVTGIGSSALSSCDQITSLTCSELVTTIDMYACESCSSLEKVDIPGVVSIEAWAFRECPKLSVINFGEGLKSIGNFCFDNALSLTEITLPSTVTNLGGFVFEKCANLKSITCKAVTPPAIKKGIDNSGAEIYTLFEDVDYADYEGVTLYVPAESIEAYKSANGWWQFKDNIVAMPDNSSIASIEADLNDAPVEYYNLQGVRIDNPTNGLYIRRQGKTVAKVLVK